MRGESATKHTKGHEEIPKMPPDSAPSSRFVSLRALRGQFFIFLSLLTALFVVYSSVLLLPYAFGDDYFYLDKVVLQHQSIYPDMAVQGRPITGLILQLALQLAGTLSGLRWLRLITIIEIAGAGWLLYFALVRLRWPPTHAALLAAIACFTPAMQVYAAWATSLPVPLSAIAAIGAAILTGWAQEHWKARWPALVAATILLLVSATIYQPTAFLFVPLAALDLSKPRRAVAYFVVAGISLSMAWLVLKHGIAEYPEFARPGRSGITHDLTGKLTGFIQLPLTDAITFFGLQPRPILALTIGIIITIGMLRYFSGGALRRLISTCIAGMLLPLSYLPSLLARQMEWDFRTQIALEWTVLLLAFLALNGLLRTIWRQTIFLTLAAIFAGGLAAYHVAALIAWPQFFELSYLRNALCDPNMALATNVILIPPSREDSAASYSRYEFGTHSTMLLWVPVAAVNLIRNEINPDSPRVPVKLVPDFSQSPPPDTLLIDMRRYAERR
jgi:hypothetical protein